MTQSITSTGQGLFSPVGSVGASKGCAFWGRHWRPAPLDPRKDLRSLHSGAEQPDRQNFAKSSLPACPVLLRCRSACKLFLPDLLRRMASSWFALVVAALPRKSIMACSRSCCYQGTMFARSRGLSKVRVGLFWKVVPIPYTNLKGYF